MTEVSRKRVRFSCSECDAKAEAFLNTARAQRQVCRSCYGKGEDRRPRELNQLTGKEWAQYSRSVEEYPDTRSEKQRTHGAAFPASLARQQVSIYTAPGDIVLDPFAGVGTTLDVCAELGRRGVGIELNPTFADLARADLPADESQRIIVDDCRRMADHVKPDSIDFLLTSPPYGALLKHVRGDFAYKWQEHSQIRPVRNAAAYSSEDPLDLGNFAYSDFLVALQDVMAASFDALKLGAYAVWVVKDFRALKAGAPFVPLHMHTMQAAESAGFTLWDLKIYDQTRFRPLVCLGYPSSNYYLNIGHSYLVVLRKR